jgi:hypothetical protein
VDEASLGIREAAGLAKLVVFDALKGLCESCAPIELTTTTAGWGEAVAKPADAVRSV